MKTIDLMKTTIKHLFPFHTAMRRYRMVLFMIMTLSAVLSCKNTETDIIPGTTTVSINISEISFESAGTTGGGRKASANIGNSNTGTAVQTGTIKLNDDFYLVAELIPELPVEAKIKKSASAGQRAAMDSSYMVKDIRYRVLVYDDAQKCVAEQEYIRGQESSASKFDLDGGKTYTFVVYSNNSKAPLPAGTFLGKTLAASTLTVDGSADFLYAKIEQKVVAGIDNRVNVKLKRQFSQITLKVDASVTGYNITELRDVMLSPHHRTSVIDLSDGGNDRTAPNPLAVNFTALGQQQVTSTPFIVNAATNNSTSITIGKMTIGPLTQTAISIPTKYTVAPGTNYILKITINNMDEFLTHQNQKAVRIGGQIWMRHNLGASTALDPDQNPAVVGLHGNFYQWGRNIVVAAGNANVANNRWNTGTAPANTAWNTGTEDNPKKNTANDPCPAGYRMPTRTEYLKLLDNTTATNIGKWETTDQVRTNFSAAKVLTSKRKAGIKITLPAQGWMAPSATAPHVSHGIRWRGSVTVNVSSTAQGTNSLFYLRYDNTNYTTTLVTGNYYKYGGYTVRCIAGT